MAGNADFCRDRVREADRDRYLSALYAPEALRPALFALYAFNAEVAEAMARAHDPLPGEIRLQWWREVLTGGSYSAEGSPIATELLAAVQAHQLPRSAFETYLDARTADLYADPFETRTELEAYCGGTASLLMQLAALILDKQAAPLAAEAAGHGGCAQGIAGLVRLAPLHRGRGKITVPLDLLSAAGLDAEAFLRGEDRGRLLVARDMMVALARDHLARFEAQAKDLPAQLRPAFLPLAPVPLYLRRIETGEPGELVRDVADFRRQWAIMRSAARGW